MCKKAFLHLTDTPLTTRTFPSIALVFRHIAVLKGRPCCSLTNAIPPVYRNRTMHRHANGKALGTTIDVSALQVTPTTTPKPITPNEELVFGRTFTDHMLSLEWTAAEGWLSPRI